MGIIRLAITAYSCIKTKMPIINLELCPNQNACTVTLPDDPEALPCGRSPEQLKPLFLAEDVCIEALRGALAIENTQMRDTDLSQTTAEQDLQLGSLYFGLALHNSTSPAEAEAFFAYGRSVLECARDKADAWKKLRLNAGLLVADLPLFIARKYKEKVSDETLDAVQLDIAKLHAIVEDEHDSSPGWLANLGLHQFLLRDGLVSYAGDFRENCGGNRRLTRVQRKSGHWAYLIGNSGEKVPMNACHQEKQRLASDIPVKIPVGQIIEVTIDAMAPEIRESHPTSENLSQLVIGWTIEEARADLDEQRTSILDMVSDTIVGRIEQRFPGFEKK